MPLSSVPQHKQIKGYCSTGDSFVQKRSCGLVIALKPKHTGINQKGCISVEATGISVILLFVQHPAQLECADPQSLSKV